MATTDLYITFRSRKRWWVTPLARVYRLAGWLGIPFDRARVFNRLISGCTLLIPRGNEIPCRDLVKAVWHRNATFGLTLMRNGIPITVRVTTEMDGCPTLDDAEDFEIKLARALAAIPGVLHVNVNGEKVI